MRSTLRMSRMATILVWAAASLALAARATAQHVPNDDRSAWRMPNTRTVAVVPTMVGRPAATPARAAWSVPRRMPRLSWSRSDVALAGGFAVALWIDAAQTRGLARAGWREYREANPVLGPRPTVRQINAYTAVAGLTVLGAAAAVPARLRPWLLGAALAVETVTVAGTARKGIAITFR